MCNSLSVLYLLLFVPRCRSHVLSGSGRSLTPLSRPQWVAATAELDDLQLEDDLQRQQTQPVSRVAALLP